MLYFIHAADDDRPCRRRVHWLVQRPQQKDQVVQQHCTVVCTYFHTSTYFYVYTRRFASRAAYAARYARSERKNGVKRKKEKSMLDCNKCKLVTWKCQEPRHHALGKQPTDATRVGIPRMYLVSCCTGDVYSYYIPGICLSRSLWLYEDFVARMTNRHGHRLGVLDY